MFARLRQTLGLAEVVGTVIPVILLLFMFSQSDEMRLLKDSNGYLTFAEMILSGDLFEKKPVSQIGFTRAARTPGYPLLAALAMSTFSDERQGMLIIHLIIGLFALIFLCISLKAYSPPILTGTVVVITQFFMSDYYAYLMSEWVAFNLLLITFGLVVTAFTNPSFRNLLYIALVATSSVLIRPTMAPLLLLTPLLLLYRRRLGGIEGGLLALTVAPLLMWLSFNLYHVDAFRFAALNGHMAYGIATQIGHAATEPGDSVELQQFIAEVNEKKDPPKGTEEEFIRNFDENYEMMRVELNLFIVAYPLKQEDMSAIAFDREFLGVYGSRVIDKHPDRYVKYVITGMKKLLLFGSPYAVLFLLVIPLFGLYRRKNLILSYAALAMFAIHFGQGLLCAAFLFTFDRYTALTFYPYMGSVCICFIGLLYAEDLPERLLSRLPEGLRNFIGPLVRIA